MFGPVLRGERVILRPVEDAEADLFRRWLADSDVTRFLLRTFPPSEAAEREWLDRVGRSDTDVVWGIEFEERLVGTAAVHSIDWANGHGTTGTLVGDSTAWGQGAGGETMRLRTRWCFTETTLHKLNSAYLDGNLASARAQAGAGYVEIGRRREQYFRGGRWIDEILTEILRDDWLRAHPPA